MAMTVPLPASSGVVFHDVTWADYEAQLRIVGERPIRVTFDQGTMEIFMPSLGHEDDAYQLGRVVDTLTEELGSAVKAGRTTTHKRQVLDRGAEPDQCYWLGEAATRMAGKRQLDLTIDPPPSLAIEVDVSRSSLDRLAIFGAIGIPEFWRLTAGSLHFLHRQPGGSYLRQETSLAFPGLPATEVARFLEQGQSGEDTAWVRSFRAYVNQVYLPGRA